MEALHGTEASEWVPRSTGFISLYPLRNLLIRIPPAHWRNGAKGPIFSSAWRARISVHTPAFSIPSPHTPNPWTLAPSRRIPGLSVIGVPQGYKGTKQQKTNARTPNGSEPISSGPDSQPDTELGLDLTLSCLPDPMPLALVAEDAEDVS